MRRKLSVLFGVVAFTLPLSIGVGSSSIASAATSGSISGVVTNASSVPEANVCVTAFGTGDSFNATTDSSGDYTISNLPADDYAVEFDPSCDGTISSTLAIQFYQYEPDIGLADGVEVGTSNVAGIDAVLETASTISGTVTNGTSPVGDVCVLVYTNDGYLFPTPDISTASDGTYLVQNLPNASYKVLFDPTCVDSILNSPYASQYYSDEPDFGVATLITFHAPTTETGINATLAAGASISGTITAPDAANAANVCVNAYSASGEWFQSLALTNASGAYDITNLPADSYKLAVDPTCYGIDTSDFAVGWYSAAASFPAATTVSLTTGEALAGINDTLVLAVSSPSISTTSLSSGTEGTSYSATVQASGGTGPYDWVASGLPSGLSINASTGAISGTPTSSGSFNISVTATDASTPPVVATASLSLSIAQPAVTTTVPPTTTAPITETVCSAKTKTLMIRTVEVKHGKKVIVVTHKKVRVYKTVTIRKVEKVHGKKIIVVTHKQETVQVCKTITVA